MVPGRRRVWGWPALLLCLSSCSAPEGPYDSSDVVLIVVDTLRADRLAAYGCEVETAPFLSSLAEEAVVFERAWSASSWTAPATASIFTSMYPDRHGLVMNPVQYQVASGARSFERPNRIPVEIETVPTFFRSRGYRTYGISDNPIVADRLGFDRGFDRFASLPYESADAVLGVLRGWAEELRANEGPDFLYLHFVDPHEPYHERAPWFREPDPKQAAGRPYARELAAYDSEIRYLDEHLAELFELLELDGRALVVLTSDHGEEFGEHGQLGHFPTLYSELTHVPLLFLLPRGEGGARWFGRVNANVSTLDLLPTFRELSGLEPGPHQEGTSLADWLEPRTDSPLGNRAVFATRSTFKDGTSFERRSVVQGDLKLITIQPDATVALFDLASDPGEKANLVLERKRVANRLVNALREFEEREQGFVPAAAPPLPEFTESELEVLHGLGYTGDS